MKNSANKTRQQAAVFRKSDHVWLNLKNIKTPQLLKKLFVAGAVALQGFASSPEHIATHAPL
jgi:hypothetical protein